MDFNPFIDLTTCTVKIKPQSKRNQLSLIDGLIVIETTAPATDNKANNAVLKWLKKQYKVNAEIVRGKTSRLKVLAIKS